MYTKLSGYSSCKNNIALLSSSPPPAAADFCCCFSRDRQPFSNAVVDARIDGTRRPTVVIIIIIFYCTVFKKKKIIKNKRYRQPSVAYNIVFFTSQYLILITYRGVIGRGCVSTACLVRDIIDSLCPHLDLVRFQSADHYRLARCIGARHIIIINIIDSISIRTRSPPSRGVVYTGYPFKCFI